MMCTTDANDGSSSLGAVYVAYVAASLQKLPSSLRLLIDFFSFRYHDWEHFSSVRNLIGPHSGLPYTVEKLATSQSASQSASSKAKGKALSPQSSQSSILSSAVEDELNDEEHGLPSPMDTPLPISRSSSLSPSSETSASTSAPSSSLSVPPLPGYNRPLDTGQSKPGSHSKRLSLRMNHSPKRAYNGIDEAAEDSQGEAKRSRSVRHASGSQVQAKANKEVDAADNDPDADTPELLSSGESSSVSSSPAATPPPSMVVVPPSPVTRAKPLTRRQRKALGLPGPRSELGKNGKSAGKIVVPGGRFKNSSSAPVSTKTDEGEWTKNGTGRVDVRGFKELKI
ncbi:hypothetical protein DFH11DRAFT_130435 [Phellopilus nigrolimitatus]|nr:hypothetical protein DFH11DRAFT_130435 [Phellopilus nigrolimitatus]